jgi:hypothetical protein
MPRILGRRLFTDGDERDVFEDDDGGQYVDDDGERVDGQWLLPADEAVVVERQHSTSGRSLFWP